MDYSGNCQSFVSGDDLFVDELLDLSNGFSEDEENENENNNSSSSQQIKECDKETVIIPSGKQDFGSLLGCEISLPGADLDNLEWLSHFVEDSFSEYSLTYSAGNLPGKSLKLHSNVEIPVREKPCFTAPLGAEREKNKPPSMSFSSSSSTTANSFWGELSVENKPAARKPKKKMEKRIGIGAKQCSHCGVQKTPLWRTGPLGEKTLCNACGVRFKSGRLLPEYRPASSPTFSTGLHSNSHRKVLEMRQKKETEPGPPVQSF
ncbi:GATA transcription factor 5 [Solanum lycopersicum]|uniref:GATA transcription factor n=1 Tax=Solanum lycopersicum TaxID=4081 RepID=A0A3Q7EYN4_SOLLC|nr:GATA transcription factor 5 [Solanum lycopersicum]XP_010317231.1 GATA transcription factor 5 [Solanum lycopersicum]